MFLPHPLSNSFLDLVTFFFPPVWTAKDLIFIAILSVTENFSCFPPLVPQHKRAVVLMENDKELRHGGVIRCPRERELNPPEKREKRVFH